MSTSTRIVGRHLSLLLLLGTPVALLTSTAAPRTDNDLGSVVAGAVTSGTAVRPDVETVEPLASPAASLPAAASPDPATDPATGPSTAAATAPAASWTRDPALMPTALDLHDPAETFALHSLPGSRHTVYLDFDGAIVENTDWNRRTGKPTLTAEPFSLDPDPGFNDAELLTIQRVWQAVAEDYAPFNVDVTTQRPSPAALTRDSVSDDIGGVPVIISPSLDITSACPQPSVCAGIAINDGWSFTGNNSAFRQPVWVVSSRLGNSAKAIGDAASHEVGHYVGLDHSGGGYNSQAVYSPGYVPWGPLMGAPYNVALTTWTDGYYANSSYFGDQVENIATDWGYRPDAEPNTVASAQILTKGVPATGVISTPGDVDVYAFTASAETALRVIGADGWTNLDVKVTIVDANVTVVKTIDPITTQEPTKPAVGADARALITYPAGGTLYAIIDGTGQGDNSDGPGYDDSGSLGNYTIEFDTPVNLDDQTFTATAGSPFTANIAFRGGDGKTAWSASGLPSWATLTGGKITGTPPGGFSTVRFTVTAESGPSADSGVITIAPSAPPLAWMSTATKLKAARYKIAYSVSVGWSGGTAPYSASVTSGVLPTGLRLTYDSTKRLFTIAGKPTKKQTATFSVTVKDAAAKTLTRTFTIKVS